MNKRMRKKYLTQDEKLVIELYRQCQYAEFKIYRVEKPLDCFAFTDQVEVTSELHKNGGSIWTNAMNGKIEATAFLKN